MLPRSRPGDTNEPLGVPLVGRASGRISVLALAVCVAVFLAAILAAILFKAWVCDDAYITVRTADNWARGLGPTWNPGERVQVYTHPLWLFLLSAAHLLTQEFAYTAVFLGLLLSTATVLLFAFRAAPTVPAACLGVAILTTSRAFTDYSTSGLENPLTNVLLVLFAWIFLGRGSVPRGPGILGVLLGLTLLNRIDAGLRPPRTPGALRPAAGGRRPPTRIL